MVKETMNAAKMHRIGEFSGTVAAMVEFARTVQRAILRRSNFFADANILIFGAVFIDIMVARWAKFARVGGRPEDISFVDGTGSGSALASAIDWVLAARS